MSVADVLDALANKLEKGMNRPMTRREFLKEALKKVAGASAALALPQIFTNQAYASPKRGVDPNMLYNQPLPGAAGMLQKVIDDLGGYFEGDVEQYFMNEILKRAGFKDSGDPRCAYINDPHNGKYIDGDGDIKHKWLRKGVDGRSNPDWGINLRVIRRIIEEGEIRAVAGSWRGNLFREFSYITGEKVVSAEIYPSYLYNRKKVGRNIIYLVETAQATDRYLAKKISRQTPYILTKTKNGPWVLGVYSYGTIKYTTSSGNVSYYTGPMYFVVEIAESTLKNIFNTCFNGSGGGKI